MAANKTVPTAVTVDSFLRGVSNPKRRQDAIELTKLIADATGATPAMWGPSIVGFGTHTYHYGSGRTGETAAVGFAPRAQALVIYGLLDDTEHTTAQRARLGPHTIGKGCLYVKALADVDRPTLSEMITAAYISRHAD